MKTKYWLILLGAVFLLSCAAAACLWLCHPARNTAVVSVEGKELYRLDLSKDCDFAVESRWGSNRITVKDGMIAVSEADCPTQLCVGRGFVNGGMPIICLPHRLSVSFSDDGEIDAWTR